jgi:signal transduction histidine kinase
VRATGLEARGARLTVRYAAEPLPVSLEPDAFALVLNNLLDNAVKYSPGAVKPVTVTLRADGDLVRLHVDDEGVGLGPAERERVFERFYRAGDEMTRTSAGVGLGLHLVRSVTEAMNGWVQVEDTPRGAARASPSCCRGGWPATTTRPTAPAAGPSFSS